MEKTRVIFFFKKNPKNSKRIEFVQLKFHLWYLICPWNITMYLCFILYRKLHSCPLLLKAPQHWINVRAEIKTRRYMRKAWKLECRQLCTPGMILKWRQTMLQPAYWLARNCGHPDEVPSEYIPNGVLKTTV